MLRYFVLIKILPFSTCSQILEALRVECENETPRFASSLERGNENIKYSFLRVGFELTTCLVSVARLCRFATNDLKKNVTCVN